MPNMTEDVITHELNIDPNIKLIAQKWRPVGDEKVIAIRHEVGKLVNAQIVKKTKFQPVLVSKSNDKWRMCVDFRNLKKACPKDSYPLPRIEQLVDATSGHECILQV